MTCWPETLAELGRDDVIRADGPWGASPGPAGYALADLSCSPAPGRWRAGAVYGEAAVAIVLSGAFEYTSESRPQVAVPGALLFANRGEAFSCGHLYAEKNRRVVLFLSDATIKSVAEDLDLDEPRFATRFAPPCALTPAVAGRLMRIAKEGAGAEEDAIAIAQTALSYANPQADRSGPAPGDARRILDVVRHINAHYAAPCTLDELAAVAGMSRFRFARRFRAVVGETANRYVLNRRLSAAAARLLATRARVSEIAYEVGFNDISYFNTRFKTAFGCSPRAWRVH